AGQSTAAVQLDSPRFREPPIARAYARVRDARSYVHQFPSLHGQAPRVLPHSLPESAPGAADYQRLLPNHTSIDHRSRDSRFAVSSPKTERDTPKVPNAPCSVRARSVQKAEMGVCQGKPGMAGVCSREPNTTARATTLQERPAMRLRE